jgi:hypothetical protein
MDNHERLQLARQAEALLGNPAFQAAIVRYRQQILAGIEATAAALDTTRLLRPGGSFLGLGLDAVDSPCSSRRGPRREMRADHRWRAPVARIAAEQEPAGLARWLPREGFSPLGSEDACARQSADHDACGLGLLALSAAGDCHRAATASAPRKYMRFGADEAAAVRVSPWGLIGAKKRATDEAARALG